VTGANFGLHTRRFADEHHRPMPDSTTDIAGAGFWSGSVTTGGASGAPNLLRTMRYPGRITDLPHLPEPPVHDLIPSPAAGALSTAEIDLAMHFAENEKSASTRKAYATDWKDFAAWCAARCAMPLPAHPGIVAAYLSSLAQAGREALTIARKAAAIGHRHKLAGLEPPTAAEGVKAVMRGIRRSVGVAKAAKAPATAAIVRRMLDGCGDRLIDVRDPALLAFGLASATRRDELCALQVEDLTEMPDGLRVLIRRSKTDQTGQGQQEIAIPRGAKLCPVEALQAWLAAACIASGLTPESRHISAGFSPTRLIPPMPLCSTTRGAGAEGPGAVGGADKAPARECDRARAVWKIESSLAPKRGDGARQPALPAKP
jgi:integrase